MFSGILQDGSGQLNVIKAGAAAQTESLTGLNTFTGATVESNPLASAGAAPTSGMSFRRGLWYSVVGTGNTMTASLCNSARDRPADRVV